MHPRTASGLLLMAVAVLCLFIGAGRYINTVPGQPSLHVPVLPTPHVATPSPSPVPPTRIVAQGTPEAAPPTDLRLDEAPAALPATLETAPPTAPVKDTAEPVLHTALRTTLGPSGASADPPPTPAPVPPPPKPTGSPGMARVEPPSIAPAKAARSGANQTGGAPDPMPALNFTFQSPCVSWVTNQPDLQGLGHAQVTVTGRGGCGRAWGRGGVILSLCVHQLGRPHRIYVTPALAHPFSMGHAWQCQLEVVSSGQSWGRPAFSFVRSIAHRPSA